MVEKIQQIQHVYYPYIICPKCGEQIMCKPDFEFYISYIKNFGGLGNPMLRINKHIPVQKILQNENLFVKKRALKDFLIKISHKQPLFCTGILTRTAYETLNKMVELEIVKHEEIYNEL